MHNVESKFLFFFKPVNILQKNNDEFVRTLKDQFVFHKKKLQLFFVAKKFNQVIRSAFLSIPTSEFLGLFFS